MSAARATPRPAQRLPGPPLQFSILVAGMYLRYVKLPVERISVRRTDGADGITWDQLQSIKREIGRGHVAAVELYPPDEAVVAVANMRHLWALPVGAEPAWMWRPRPSSGSASCADTPMTDSPAWKDAAAYLTGARVSRG